MLVESNVKLFRFFRPLHDEPEPRRQILPHQLVEHAVRQDLIDDLDPEQTPRSQRSLSQQLRHHLAKTREPRNFHPAAAGRLLEDVVLVAIVERPVRFLADVNTVQRRLGVPRI